MSASKKYYNEQLEAVKGENISIKIHSENGESNFLNLNDESINILIEYLESKKTPQTVYGMCVYCLDMDTDLTEVHGVYGVGSCCTEEHENETK